MRMALAAVVVASCGLRPPFPPARQHLPARL